MRIDKYIFVALFLLIAPFYSCGPKSMEAESAPASMDSLEYPEAVQQQIESDLSSDTLSAEQKELFGKRAIQKLEDYYSCLEIIWDKQYDSTLRTQAKLVAENLFYNKSEIPAGDFDQDSAGKIMAVNFFISTPPKAINDSTYVGVIQHACGFDHNVRSHVNFSIRKVRKNFATEQKIVWEAFLGSD
jgi:hypothetical protein